MADIVESVIRQPTIRIPALRRLFRKREITTLIATIAIFIYFSLTAKGFLTVENILSITQLFSLWCIVGVGETMLIISKEIDISVGSMYILLMIVMGYFVGIFGWNVWLGSIGTLAVGTGIGIVNGLLVTKIGIKSLIVTVGGYAAFRGLAIIICGGYPIMIYAQSPLFDAITGGYAFEVVPWMSIWMGMIAIVGAVVLAYTRFGYHIYATGGNLQAARNTGINTDRVKIACFAITGALVAVISVITVGWLGAASSQGYGGAFELQVIAATILGGTYIYGGRGSVVGTVVGAFLLGMIVNGLVRIGLSNYWEGLATGVIILIVMTMEALVKRIRKR
jgi:ribose/xylose/arabinose/galactoside ABC-type transport system permease subunit